MLKHISMTAYSTLISTFLACGVTNACPWKYDACLVMLRVQLPAFLNTCQMLFVPVKTVGQRVFCRCPAQRPQRGALHNTGLEKDRGRQAHLRASGTTLASRQTAPATTGDATEVPERLRQPP